jgi:hypothetical protein
VTDILVRHQASKRRHLTLAITDRLTQLLIAELSVELRLGQIAGWLDQAETLDTAAIGAMTGRARPLKYASAPSERGLVALASERQAACTNPGHGARENGAPAPH